MVPERGKNVRNKVSFLFTIKQNNTMDVFRHG